VLIIKPTKQFRKDVKKIKASGSKDIKKIKGNHYTIRCRKKTG
jgi:hypothetical protein